MTTNPFFLKTLWRHKTSFGSIFLAGTLASYAVIQHIPSSYSARAIIEIPQNMSLAAQMNSLRSPELLGAVIDNLELLQNQAPASNGDFKTLSLFGQTPSSPPASSHAKAQMIKDLQAALRVKPLNEAKQIEISFKATDPDLAAALGNALVEAKLSQYEVQKAKTSEIYSSISQKIEDMQLNIAALDEKIIQSHADLAKNNIEAEYSFEQDLASLQGEIEKLESQKKNLDTAPTQNAALASLEAKKLQIKAQQQNLATRYGAKHPKMLALAKQIKQTNAAIKSEQHAIALAQKQSRDDLDTQIAMLEIELGNIAPAAGADVSPALDALKYARDGQQKILKSLINQQTQNAKTLRGRSNLPVLVAAASPVDKPVSLDKPVLMAYAIAFFAALGAVPGSLIELRRRKSFQSKNDLEQKTGRPCFGRLALVEDFKGKPVADYVLDDPQSSLSEAIRALRLQLKLRSPQNNGGQVVMFTSALGAEGKTTTALWLARQAAQSGMRTILIDADLRTPAVHKALNADNTVSITDLLTGRSLLDQCIRKDMKTGLHVLLGAPTPSSATDLLSNDKLSSMFTTLRKNYDLIIVDTQAALSVADSRAIAPFADQIMFMVRWNATQVELVHSAIEEISGFSTAPIATVLAAINVKEHAKLGFGDVICTYEAA